MKWNWGTKIFIAIILFMSMMIVLVILTFKQSFDLVEKDYYPKGLEYQKQIDKETNAKNSGIKIYIKNSGSELQVSFPVDYNSTKLSGNIIMYRPSDGSKDIIIPLDLDTLNRMVISTSTFIKGKYIVKFDYKVGDMEYFQKESIFIEK